MAIKDKLITKVFSKEGTDQSKEAVKPMKPDNILPIFQLIIAVLIFFGFAFNFNSFNSFSTSPYEVIFR